MMTAMPHSSPSLTIALALALGIVFQNIAHHLRIPGIVLLLAVGVLFGPDGLGFIHPEALGPALGIITGFAVAVILFEGGLKLKFRQLKREQRSIRQLIVLGSMVTVGGGTLSAHFILGWPLQTAFLFGTLIMVTGPTVINPLLKRLKVKKSVHTVLEAEGILIDAVGAVVATVALEAALGPADSGLLLWVGHIVTRLGFGSICGLVAGFLMVGVLRSRRWVPEGTENVFSLSLVLLLFQGANYIMPESGIAAVTMAGIIVGNFSTYALRDLIDFKEELTILFIGMLFVLLAADVRLDHITALGIPGLLTVLAVMLLVRPLSVMAGTAFSGLPWRERIFIGWIGPRGIVAAAVASLFAAELSRKGMPGGYALRALVFLVITVTVISAGLTGGIVASLLGLRRESGTGWVILSANEIARAIAKIMKQHGQDVISIDANAENCSAAEADCARVIFGNGLQTRNLLRAQIDMRAGAVALTPNEEINYLFLQKVKEEAKEVKLYSAIKPSRDTLPDKMMDKLGVNVAFSGPLDVELWCTRIRRQQIGLEVWGMGQNAENMSESNEKMDDDPNYFVLLVKNRDAIELFTARRRLREGETAFVLVLTSAREAAHMSLRGKGWVLVETFPEDALSTNMCEL